MARPRPPFFLFSILVLLAWEYLPGSFSIPEYIFPNFSSVVTSLIENKSNVFENSLTTLTEAVLGFFLGCSVAFSLGVLLALSRLWREALLPYVIGSNAIPIVAVSPLIVLWFGHDLFSKVIVAAFLSFFPFAINTYKGLEQITRAELDLFRIYGSTNQDIFWKLRLPKAVPFLFAGLKLSATYAVIGAVVGEFVGADSGLGYGILQASYSLNTPRLFAYLITSCAMGLMMYGLVALIERRFIKYDGNVDEET